jgi:hypothetical protein
MSLSKPPRPPPVPTDEDINAHINAMFDVDSKYRSKVGVPFHMGGCNRSHKVTTTCKHCAWNCCQFCFGLKPITEEVTCWTYICAECLMEGYQLPVVPDEFKAYYTEKTQPAMASGGSMAGAPPLPSTPSDKEAGGDFRCMSSFAGHTPRRTPGSFRRPYANPLLASPGAIPASDPSPAQDPAILISSDDDIVVKKEKEEDEKDLTPEEKKEKEFSAKYPEIPADWENGPEFNLFLKKRVDIFEYGFGGNRVLKPKYIKAVFLVATYLDETIKNCQRLQTRPPHGFEFGQNPSPFRIRKITRLQDYGQYVQFMLAAEMARKRNDERPDAEKVFSGQIVRNFMHGTSEECAQSIFNDGVRPNRNTNHAFGIGLYGSVDVVGVVLEYARRKGVNVGKASAILLGKAVIGKHGQTFGGADVAPRDCDSGGNDRNWVTVIFDGVKFLPEYIIVIDYLSRDATGSAEWQSQLAWIKSEHDAFCAMEEAQRQSIKTAKEEEEARKKKEALLKLDPAVGDSKPCAVSKPPAGRTITASKVVAGAAPAGSLSDPVGRIAAAQAIAGGAYAVAAPAAGGGPAAGKKVVPTTMMRIPAASARIGAKKHKAGATSARKGGSAVKRLKKTTYRIVFQAKDLATVSTNPTATSTDPAAKSTAAKQDDEEMFESDFDDSDFSESSSEEWSP